MAAIRLTAKSTALIIIDVQEAFHEMEAAGARRNNPGAERNIAALLAAFRVSAASIIHIRHRNAAPQSRFNPANSGYAVLDEAREIAGEPVIVKDVNSAFIGTDLDKRLHANGIDTVVIAGATTNHCVETTTRMAGNLGYNTFLAADASWTFDRPAPDGRLYPAADVHAMSLANLNEEFCTVASASEIIAAL
jgi:nicotinamidase-related amidase